MAFNLVDASYDAQAQRAYVLLRDTDEDGEEMVVSLTFSYRTFMPLPFRHRKSCTKPARFCSRRRRTSSGRAAICA